MAERLRALFLNHSVISPLCLVWVRVPLRPHMRQAKFCLRVCQVFFLGVFPFAHLLIGPSHMSCNLERDVKLNSKTHTKKKKKKKKKNTSTSKHKNSAHYKILKWLYLSRLMGTPTICIGENKDADCSTIPPLLNSKILSF